MPSSNRPGPRRASRPLLPPFSPPSIDLFCELHRRRPSRRCGATSRSTIPPSFPASKWRRSRKVRRFARVSKPRCGGRPRSRHPWRTPNPRLDKSPRQMCPSCKRPRWKRRPEPSIVPALPSVPELVRNVPLPPPRPVLLLAAKEAAEPSPPRGLARTPSQPGPSAVAPDGRSVPPEALRLTGGRRGHGLCTFPTAVASARS